MVGIDAPVEQRSTISSDGTLITYYVIGTGERVWLVPPSLGGPLLTMKAIFDRFHEDYTLIYWDMRGFHRSGRPADPEAYDLSYHLEDLLAVRRAEQLRRFVLGGWSMAVQLSLEFCHRHPDDVRALVLVNGPYERVLDGAVPQSRALADLVAQLLRFKRLLGLPLNALSRGLAQLSFRSWLLEQVGVLAVNSEHFEAVFEEFLKVDWPTYLTTMRKLHEHSARPYLAEIKAPTLITVGSRDVMTPVWVAEQLHRAIAGSEMVVIDGGTHNTVIEYPREITDHIARFLQRLDSED